MKPHAGSLRRSIILINFSSDLSGEKKENRQITNIRNERGDIALEIKMIRASLKNILPTNSTTQRKCTSAINYQTIKAQSRKTR